MDGGGKAAQLEVHVTRASHAWALGAIALVFPVALYAQRQQVAAGDSANKTVTVVEFRLCIPAETSDCGAWVDHVVDLAGDAGAGLPPAVRALRTPNGRDSLWIEDGAVKLRVGAAPRARTYVVRDARGSAIALAASADPRYAFALLDAPPGASGAHSTIVMIDLESRSIVDSFGSRTRLSGIAMVR